MKVRRLELAAIIVIAVGVAIKCERDVRRRANYLKARGQIAELQEALRRYQADNGYYPTTDQGLSALGEYYSDGPWQPETSRLDPGMVFPRRPLVGPHPTDPWSNPYFYQSDGNMYELRSFGPNGFRNGSEDEALVARSPRPPAN